MRDIKRIFVHCTAGSQKQTKNDLLREFKAKGWSAPGYHYVVFPDGRVDSLLAEDKVSNGVQGFNSTAINIAYVGGIDSKGRATDNQFAAVAQHQVEFAVAIAEIAAEQFHAPFLQGFGGDVLAFLSQSKMGGFEPMPARGQQAPKTLQKFHFSPP